MFKEISRVCASNNKKSKKRKIIMDYDKTLSHDVIKKQMMDVTDITSAFDLAPASRRLMILKQIGTVEQLLCLPALKILNNDISHVYKRNLKTCKHDQFSSEEDEISESSHRSQSKSKKRRFKMNKNASLAETRTECILEQEDCVNNIEHSFPFMKEEFMEEMEPMCMAFESTEKNYSNVLPKETESDYNHIQSNTLELQNTQMSKTSEEKWEYALQGRIIQMLLHLKELFEENSVIHFSFVVKNKKKYQVAQTFLCLLMLKKLQLISLQQSQCFDEILISPEDRFQDVSSIISQA